MEPEHDARELGGGQVGQDRLHLAGDAGIVIVVDVQGEGFQMRELGKVTYAIHPVRLALERRPEKNLGRLGVNRLTFEWKEHRIPTYESFESFWFYRLQNMFKSNP